jgi:predicted DsbA family dithiol-disulfide isomerase
MNNTLKIQIWSDIMCPYCYLGKRRIEGALQKFKHQDAVEIEWKSFELDPSFKASKDDNIIDHLAVKYRKDKEWAREMVDNMTQNAKNSGLDFYFDKAILANSHNAHRLLHLAKKHKVANQLKEILFKAYLTNGKDVNNLDTLSALGQEVGLKKEVVDEVLNSNLYDEEVLNDIAVAQQIGIQGVPFFVFDNKYAISGAQHEQTFLQTLEKVWEEGSFTKKVTELGDANGERCDVEGCN